MSKETEIAEIQELLSPMERVMQELHPQPELTAMDYIIAEITEEPVRPGSDNGDHDIWFQAEMRFLGSHYVIIAMPSGWDSEECTLYRIGENYELTVLSLSRDENGWGSQTGESIPALCALAYNDATIRYTREMIPGSI